MHIYRSEVLAKWLQIKKEFGNAWNAQIQNNLVLFLLKRKDFPPNNCFESLQKSIPLEHKLITLIHKSEIQFLGSVQSRQ